MNDPFGGDSRDPERIDDVLDELEQYWRDHPDLRLAQIVVNAYQTEWNPRDHLEDDPYNSSPFYMEDDTLLHYLEKKNDHAE